ncbi:MAG TPA: hypothetical protein VLB47_04495 [Solirubrobacteraceae bacterium]|nr:hypothetical protein [Solirubrobacteraceae bacterium]
MRRPLAATAAVLALAAVPVAGCGSSGDGTKAAPARPEQPVVRAAAATKHAGSAKVSFRGSVEAAGRRIPITGGGAVDLKASRARLTVGTRLPGAGTLSVDQLVDGQTLYVRTPALFSFLPGGKEWLKIDLARAARAKGIDLGSLRGLSASGDPSQYVAWLAVAGNARRVGRETIRGVPTTHYAARVDVRRLATSADPSLRRSVEQLGVRSVPVDVWLDGQALVRRMRLAVGSGATAVPAKMDLTIDFSDFGTAVDAAPPDAASTLDVTGTASAALKLLG